MPYTFSFRELDEGSDPSRPTEDCPEEDGFKDQVEDGQAKPPTQKVRCFSLKPIERAEKLQKVGQGMYLAISGRGEGRIDMG